MRYQITLNMPSRSGNAVHQILCDHPSRSLEELVKCAEKSDFLIVVEVYKNNKIEKGHPGHFKVKGELALNPLHIGKMKVFDEAVDDY